MDKVAPQTILPFFTKLLDNFIRGFCTMIGIVLKSVIEPNKAFLSPDLSILYPCMSE